MRPSDSLDTMAESEPFTLSYHNTKRFIQLIQARPCLWDRQCQDYKDRLMRDKAWAEICSDMDPGYRNANAAARHEISASITKKWYNIRDSYVKSLKPDHMGRRSRPYVHAELLRFLDDCYMEKMNNSSHLDKMNSKTRMDIEQAETEDVEVEAEDIETEPWEHKVFVSLNEEDDEPRPKRRRPNSPEQSLKGEAKARDEEDIISVLSNLIQKEEDEDRAFFKSITPSVKKLSDDSKLVFRIEVLKLIKNLKFKDKGKVKMKIERESNIDSDSD